MATMSAFAQEEVDGGWEKQFTPVEEADDFNAVRVAQAGDGRNDFFCYCEVQCRW